MNKIIFLDIDGVLNSITSKVDKYSGYQGIDDDKLDKLKELVNKTNAKIVLISSWKEDWFKELSYKSMQGNFGNLIDAKMFKHHLSIIDKTDDEGFNRGEGINNYLKNKSVDSFIILDDELFDYENQKLMDHLIQTDYYNNGLTDELVKKGVSMLNKDNSKLKCIGAIGGDIIGSQNEFTKSETYKIKLFNKDLCNFTDDTVMTIAVMDYFINNKRPSLVYYLKKWFKKYPNAGYGGRFASWCLSNNNEPYNSYGNGSAMRVSPVVYVAKSLDECLKLAKETAEVTHNHPEGIKGAQAIAGCAFLAKQGKSKKEIAKFAIKYYPEIEKMLNYPSIHDKNLREEYDFDVTCQGSCPIAIYIFLTTNSYEDMNYKINYIGGDTDTIGAMAGVIGETFYGLTSLQEKIILSFLPEEIIKIINKFSELF